MLGGMRASNASLTRASTSPDEEEEAKAREASCNIPQLVDITSAADMPLLVASPVTSPSRPHLAKSSSIE
jgi:hypothetical protein